MKFERFFFFKDIVNVAAVDATVHQSFGGRFQIQGFPTIKIFGANKNSPTDYQGKLVSLSW